ncbi:MAG: pilus assembly protein PilP [Deltaproteobacteria bacterium]|nr:pilus assembly protein PilP [Deltaproteobacteria bacterium]
MRNAAVAVSIALLVLAGCDKETNQPTSEEFQQERAALNARVEARKAKKPARQAAPAAPSQIAAVPAGVPLAESFAGTGGTIVYDRTDLRDPFRSFEWERKELAIEDMDGGPLEQFDVSQLSVIAVVWKTGSARALVEDPGGESYIIAKGTRIGKNDGTVTKIDDNLVVVNESYEDYLGNVTQKDVELRIRRSEGG